MFYIAGDCEIWTLNQTYTREEGLKHGTTDTNFTQCKEMCINIPVCTAIEWHYYRPTYHYQCYHHTRPNLNPGPNNYHFNLTDHTGRALYKLDRDCLGIKDSPTEMPTLG